MNSRYSVLSPSYRGMKKYSVQVNTRIVVESDFTEYKGVKISNRSAYILHSDTLKKFHRVLVKYDRRESLLEVIEASYSVLGDDCNVGVIDALILFDVFANSAEEAAEKMCRTLAGDIVINNFTLSDIDTDNMNFDCDVLHYKFDHNYSIKEITKYDETPKKYEQLASVKVIVKGDIPKFLEGMDGYCNEPYESEDLSDNENYKFEGFKLSIDGLRRVDYHFFPISFKSLDDGVAEFYFAFNFLNVNGYSEDNASDIFETIFIPKNIKISDFTFTDDENFITSKLKVVKIIKSLVEDLAVEI
ncbi:hypothetical protein ACIQGW_15835 [Lysinibacillus xylanilyticus]|uniref:hypothetical protein n=1 Tax=Lysinibacillus xylanilyticus TaxID=582475 RepID=UPI003802A4AF